ncbi:MAG TPA: LacI family DNA-binding transcriptional regulator [Herpetosiphonaceae bacterium]
MAQDHSREKRQRVTISDVASALGVAVSTVSNAYNRPDQLSAELRARVLDMAAQLGYPGPDPVARSLRQQRAGAVGVLFAERLSYAFSDPAAVLVLDGIASALEAADLGLLLVPGRSDTTATVQRALVDGFIVYSMLEEDPLVAAALARRIPTILLDQPPRVGVPAITVDDVDGARQAADHLLSLGHRRFAIITDRLTEPLVGLTSEAPLSLHEQAAHSFFVTQLRFRGYRLALEQAGLRWTDVLIQVCADNREADGAAAMRELLRQSPRPTAVLCLTDRLALGALAAIQEAGLSVPGDVSLAGFDDIPGAAQAIPPLTTIRQAHREKGLLAGQALLALLRGEKVAQAAPLPVQLVVRGTTGSAPAD